MFQKEILLILGTLLNSKELKEIRETFFAIDADSSGTITLNELKAALKEAGSTGENTPEEIIRRVDFDENGEINYSEFVSSTLDRSLLSEGNMYKVYKYLLGEGQGVLTYKSLK